MTAVGIAGGDRTVDGRPVHAGRVWRGLRIEGLLLDSRMANGAFDDLTPLTRQLRACPDTGEGDPERNAGEPIAALLGRVRAAHPKADATQVRRGLASPRSQPWDSGAFDPGAGAGGRTAWGNYRDGFQNPPIDWRIGTARKRAFFAALGQATGA